MFEVMKAALIQCDILWGEPAQNRAHYERLICRTEADLYVLPEMFDTGFVVEPDDCLSPSWSKETLSWMQAMADERDAALCGSVAVKEHDRWRNRLYFVRPQGQGGVTFYDKHHLFEYGGETLSYVPGSERVVAEWRGVRFLLQVCFDLRFPMWARCLDDYDCIIYAASWPNKRQHAWDILLQARAVENQSYVLGVNRVGKDPVCEYDGGSVVVYPYGNVIAAAPSGSEAVVTAEFDMDKLRQFREKFPVLKDRDFV
jgi:predicted amidohydrolase